MGSHRILNIFLFLLLVAVVLLNWGFRRNTEERSIEVMNEMVNSVAWESQAENPLHPGMGVMLQPVAGTIARGFDPLPYRATPEDAKRAGEELTSPYAAAAPAETSKALDRGAVVFANYCVVCHGPGGRGDGPVTKRGVLSQDLLAENAMKMKDGQMFHILSYGQKNMPSYATQIPRDDRWRAVLYVRSLQKSAAGVKP